MILHLSPEVADAEKHGLPIVALESTIITHGMPTPANLDMGRAAEAAVRESGAVPATIAVIEGRLHIGLSDDQLKSLASARNVAKLSRADMAATIASGGTGSTTVAGTMIAAHLAGIEVFATGGVGGVHRGAKNSFDISSDLQELAQTPVNVVCAGAKAILDLPKTLEVLETLGVPVIAVEQDGLPAFWSRRSGLKAPLRMDTPAELARAYLARRALGLPGGQLICNPIPARDQISFAEMQLVVETAIADADTKRITGKAVTPFLLSRIYDLTAGRSLEANISLMLNNARLAGEIAVELRRLRQED